VNWRENLLVGPATSRIDIVYVCLLFSFSFSSHSPSLLFLLRFSLVESQFNRLVFSFYSLLLYVCVYACVCVRVYVCVHQCSVISLPFFKQKYNHTDSLSYICCSDTQKLHHICLVLFRIFTEFVKVILKTTLV
jgi:hypothetical protein